MSHPLLGNYPTLRQFLFVSNMHIKDSLAPLLGRSFTASEYKRIIEGLYDTYKSASTDSFLFFRNGVPCWDAEGDEMFFRTQLTDNDGLPLWLHGIVAPEGEKNRWVVVRHEGFLSESSMPDYALKALNKPADKKDLPAEEVKKAVGPVPIMNEAKAPHGHPLLQQHPELYGELLFLNVNYIPASLYPLLPSPPPLPSLPNKPDNTVWKFYNEFSADYKNASKEDFLFLRGGAVCEEEEQADSFYFRTSLSDRDGRRIWIVAERNRSKKSHWFAKGFTAEPPAGGATPAFPPEEKAACADLPLLERYPAFSQLIFFNNEKIDERLVPLTGNLSLNWKTVPMAFNAQYQSQGMKALRFTREGQDATPEMADTLYFTTGYLTVDGKDIFLQCERNHRPGREPWFGKFLNTSDYRVSQKLELLTKVYISLGLTKVLEQFKPVNLNPVSSEVDRIEQIAKHYEKLDKEKDIQYYRNCLRIDSEDKAKQMVFPSGFRTSTGEDIMLRCTQSYKPGGLPWVAECFYLQSENPFHGIEIREWLTSWARFNRKNPSLLPREVLDSLQRIAVKESWSFKGKDDLSILESYLCYTFVRLWREGKIKSNDTYAAFNTGLVTATYEYIYAVFSRSYIGSPDGREWEFRQFCIAGEDFIGKELVKNFHPLPRPARYFDPSSPIHYCFYDTLDIKAQLPICDKEHVLLERTNRLPVPFVRQYAANSPHILQKLGELDQAETPQEKAAIWGEVKKMIRNDSNTLFQLSHGFSIALEIAVRRAVWNCRTTIPYYDPKRDQICLLLPMSLAKGNGEPDVALVLEPHESEDGQIYYEGQTIITLAMAYQNSRLVCKPESDWLSVKAVQDSGILSAGDSDKNSDDDSD